MHQKTSQCFLTRVLTRIIPIAYEQSDAGVGVDTELLWTNRNDVSNFPGTQLAAAIIDLLFTSGFTVPQSTVGESPYVRYTIWENGIGQSLSTGSSAEHISRRLEVMRLLLVFLSKAMYIPPAKLMSARNPALAHVGYNSNQRLVLTILCSFINMGLKEIPQGWGVNYRNSPAANVLETLSITTLQTLLVILSYDESNSIRNQKRPDTTDTGVSLSGSEPIISDKGKEADLSHLKSDKPQQIVSSINKGHQNLFRVFISKLHRNQEFEYLIANILRILDTTMKRNLSILSSIPIKAKTGDIVSETVMLLWCLMKYNNRLRAYIIDHNSTLRLYTILVYFMLENKDNPVRIDMLRMTTQVIHYMLESHEFATRLAQPFEQSVLPTTMRIPETAVNHGDLLVSAVYSIMMNSKTTPPQICFMLLGIIRNSGPYLTQLSRTSSRQIMRLFEIISSPPFIIDSQIHVQWLICLTEALDYVVHYRSMDNPHLIYEISKSRDMLQRLSNFNLEEAKSALAALKKNKSEIMAQKASSDHQSSNSGFLGYLSFYKKALYSSGAKSNSSASPTTVSSDRDDGPKKPTFQPTQEWVYSWLPDLPLEPLLLITEKLEPHINAIAERIEAEIASRPSIVESEQGASKPQPNTDKERMSNGQSQYMDPIVEREVTQGVVDWLGSNTAAKEFPDLESTKPKIRPRIIGSTPSMEAWYQSFLLGRIYSCDSVRFGIWKKSHCRLFVVRQR
ncbi:hypothetical protein H4219_001599 [Mycoemilia scoparia]|uniref:Uncharacterized protein n=1 Tax=Mycoemilia scoparia TaxID=417184 RepID=A0A9W7ZZV9_9FUNG|nr:hypothetical protein H4219_001599 [Mycoemilia scoparia]